MTEFYVDPWDDYDSHNMLITFIGFVMIIIMIVYIWRCCKCDEEKPATEPAPSQVRHQIPLVPCYAHEIEPGLVVLQSPDGEYFRILQEYDSTKLPKPPGGATGGSSQPPLQYIPHFTRAHFQNHTQPTAPITEQSHLIDLGNSERPPPYYSTPLQH